MLNFYICGIILIFYAYNRIKETHIFYPSVIFSIMWGTACIITGLILGNNLGPLYLEDYYVFRHIDKYIIFFTGISLLGFSIAHRINPGETVNLRIDLDATENILVKYKWLMWINFFGGIIKIILMIGVVGFNNIMDYRIAANTMMNTGAGNIGLIFRITAYIQMLANFYIALAGFTTGVKGLKFSDTLRLFILYAPNQMATGGRLFILYFILFYFGAFILARGLFFQNDKGTPFFSRQEWKAISVIMLGLFSLVSIIALARSAANPGDNKESAIAKFSYITEGILESEHYMSFNPPDEMTPDYGKHFFTGKSESYLKYRGFLNQTYMSSIVISVISPLYTSFGYYGSLFVWGIISCILELLAISCLRNLTFLRFLVYLTILKIMYETVLSNPIQGNIPIYELIILIAIFYKPIFGNIDKDENDVVTI